MGKCSVVTFPLGSHENIHLFVDALIGSAPAWGDPMVVRVCQECKDTTSLVHKLKRLGIPDGYKLEAAKRYFTLLRRHGLLAVHCAIILLGSTAVRARDMVAEMMCTELERKIGLQERIRGNENLRRAGQRRSRRLARVHQAL